MDISFIGYRQNSIRGSIMKSKVNFTAASASGSTKKRMAVPAFVTIACTYFTTAWGSGNESGKISMTFFGRYGCSSVWTPLLTGLVVALGFYIALQFSYAKKTSNYKEFVEYTAQFFGILPRLLTGIRLPTDIINCASLFLNASKHFL